ncbi:hypothetical protein [Candidatus Solirubrobacter pratensis]|uniref:hypothetical protein n=1 Tax=Candidatus Solirubrobacter pratensis TaxID=1298857 RepID=UPI00042A0974|nr:hypothetical protein [Candidatus Solirubrobacter pratensis]
MTTAELELPRRPRRKLVTPLTASLTAVLLAALGFIGGVQMQKSSGSTPSTGGAAAGGFARGGGAGGGGAAGGRAGGGAGFGGGGAGGADATTGSVANVDGKTLYVTDSSGNTIRVKTTGSSKVTRTATSKATDVHPGDTVIVQGTKSSSGTVTATSITATAKNATSGLAGLFGARGGAPANQEGNGG